MRRSGVPEEIEWLGLVAIAILLFKLGGQLAAWTMTDPPVASEPVPMQATCGVD
jgi:hypothetical protein